MTIAQRTATGLQGLTRRAKGYLTHAVPAALAARRHLAARAARAWRSARATEPFGLHEIPVQADYVTLQHRNGDAFLQCDDQGEVLRLNDTAIGLWQLCDGNKTVQQIAATLAWRFQEDEKRVREDVQAALQHFEASGFLYRSAPAVIQGAPARSSSRTRPKVFGVGWPFGPNNSSNSVRKPINFDWTNNRDEATVPLTVCIGHGVREGIDVPGIKSPG